MRRDVCLMISSCRHYRLMQPPEILHFRYYRRIALFIEYVSLMLARAWHTTAPCLRRQRMLPARRYRDTGISANVDWPRVD